MGSLYCASSPCDGVVLLMKKASNLAYGGKMFAAKIGNSLAHRNFESQVK